MRYAAALWRPGTGVLGSSQIAADRSVGDAVSADGRLLIGFSPDPYNANPGLDSVLIRVLQSEVDVLPSPHVDLPSAPGNLISSPDGSRLYVTLPDLNSIAVIE